MNYPLGCTYLISKANEIPEILNILHALYFIYNSEPFSFLFFKFNDKFYFLSHYSIIIILFFFIIISYFVPIPLYLHYYSTYRIFHEE